MVLNPETKIKTYPWYPCNRNSNELWKNVNEDLTPVLQ